MFGEASPVGWRALLSLARAVGLMPLGTDLRPASFWRFWSGLYATASLAKIVSVYVTLVVSHVAGQLRAPRSTLNGVLQALWYSLFGLVSLCNFVGFFRKVESLHGVLRSPLTARAECQPRTAGVALQVAASLATCVFTFVYTLDAFYGHDWGFTMSLYFFLWMVYNDLERIMVANLVLRVRRCFAALNDELGLVEELVRRRRGDVASAGRAGLTARIGALGVRHRRACELLRGVARCYEWPLLGVLCADFIWTALCGFLFADMLATGRVMSYSWSYGINSVGSIACTHLAARSCSLAIREAQRARVAAYRILNEDSISGEEEQQIIALILQISQTRLEFSILGLYTLDYDGLSSFLSSVMMYVLIIGQFSSGPYQYHDYAGAPITESYAGHANASGEDRVHDARAAQPAQPVLWSDYFPL